MLSYYWIPRIIGNFKLGSRYVWAEFETWTHLKLVWLGFTDRPKPKNILLRIHARGKVMIHWANSLAKIIIISEEQLPNTNTTSTSASLQHFPELTHPRGSTLIHQDIENKLHDNHFESANKLFSSSELIQNEQIHISPPPLPRHPPPTTPHSRITSTVSPRSPESRPRQRLLLQRPRPMVQRE